MVEALTKKGNHYEDLLKEALQSGYTQLQFTCVRQYDEKRVTSWMKPEWVETVYFLDEADKHKDRFNPTPAQRQLKRKMILDSKRPTVAPDVRPLIKRDGDKIRYMPDHEKCKLVQ